MSTRCWQQSSKDPTRHVTTDECLKHLIALLYACFTSSALGNGLLLSSIRPVLQNIGTEHLIKKLGKKNICNHVALPAKLISSYRQIIEIVGSKRNGLGNSATGSDVVVVVFFFIVPLVKGLFTVCLPRKTRIERGVVTYLLRVLSNRVSTGNCSVPWHPPLHCCPTNRGCSPPGTGRLVIVYRWTGNCIPGRVIRDQDKHEQSIC